MTFLTLQPSFSFSLFIVDVFGPKAGSTDIPFYLPAAQVLCVLFFLDQIDRQLKRPVNRQQPNEI